MLIEGHTPSCTRINRVVRPTHYVPQAIVMLTENVLCLKYDIKNPLTPRSNVLFEPVVRVGELLTLFARITRGQREIPSASVLRTPGMCFAVWFQPPFISRRRPEHSHE